MELSEKEIFDKIKTSVVPENFIGQGTNAEVYRIKDTDYCIRIPYIAQDMYQFNYSKELTLIDKVNHIAAKLGFGASIMKYFDGVIPKLYMNNNHCRYKFQEKISEFPIKSYSELLHQIANAIDNEMLFDFSPGNLIVDIENKKLTAIDFYAISENPRPVKPLSEMYSVLTCYGSLNETGKKIFDKVIDAGLEEFKPNITPCMDVELFDFVDLALKRNSDNNYYRQVNISEKINKFNFLMHSVSDNLKYLKELKKAEIIDKTLSSMLSEKLINFKNLIKQIR